MSSSVAYAILAPIHLEVGEDAFRYDAAPPMLARETAARQPHAAALRAVLLLAVAVDGGLVVLHIIQYPRLLDAPGSAVYVAEPAVMLCAYIGIWLWLTSLPGESRRRALTIGIVVGVLTGVLEIVDITLETFVDFSGVANILTTAPFLLGAFAAWGVAAFITTWRTSSRVAGVIAAITSAMTCMLLAIAFGLTLGFTSLPRLMILLRLDPDYLRSGWQDLHAFAIANQFDAAFSHLLGALIIGSIMGVLGSAFGHFARYRIRR